MTSRFLLCMILGISCFEVTAQDGSEKELGRFVSLPVNHEDGRYKKGECIRVYADYTFIYSAAEVSFALSSLSSVRSC